jgi:hypothetical protein
VTVCSLQDWRAVYNTHSFCFLKGFYHYIVIN